MFDDADDPEFETILTESPPEGWTRGHVTITLRGKQKLASEAWRRGAFAIHPRRDINGSRCWRITHAPTGLLIWNMDDGDTAADLVERLEPLTDWSVITEMMPAGSELYPRVRAVINKFTEPSLSDGEGATK